MDTGYWDLIRDQVLNEFRQGDYAGGIRLGVQLIVNGLTEHFPALEGDVNEVSNEIIFER